LVVWKNAVAIILGIIANSICNIGLVFKKKGACTLPEIEKQSIWQNIKNFAKCRTWVFGYCLTIFQWFPLMIAINLGDISLVAPTIGVGFVVLILFSWLFLKEPISYREIIGILVIIAAIISLYTGPLFESQGYDLIDINQFYRQPRGYGFIIGYALVIATLFGATYGRKYKQAGFFLGFASGLSYGLATIFAKGVTGSLVFREGWQVFVDNSLRQPEWWVYLLLMIIFYTTAFTTQQMAFQKGKAIIVSPTIDTMNLFLQVTAGIVIFVEWETFGDLLLWQKALKICALILIVMGVAFLSSSTALQREQTTESDDDKKDEEIKVEEDVQASEEKLSDDTTEQSEPEMEILIPVKHERRDETHPLLSGQHK
jgi:uncharacterized membrane protein